MPATTLTDRALLRLSGEDVRGFLQGLVTNDVAGALPVWAGLLTPQGKALFDFLVWADGDDLLIDCEADQADALARRLTLYRLRRPITIARDATLAVHWSPDGTDGVPDPRLGALGRRWIAPPADPADGWVAHRLALGVAEGVAEIGSDRTLWLEANAAELEGVSFVKGCYVGQENTARMNWRSKVNRRLVVLRIAEDPGEAASIWYPALGLAVARIRVEQLGQPILLGGKPAELIVPPWLKQALAETEDTA
jgi:folate-binding protein YgfZ